ncbi:DNA-binding NarL/FixJ family response regulator [Hydrogenophaga laconesensis]|uniref:DNA-binding NarL/FixJ family response regulator n=2 Tax=Hydrogenophaga laconesensis TaxID=1805971 RepID=A0ABU1V7D9_9BURK|nr:response regulator [Hydrogenophaga laconesensis]MDR7093378.1 DNA-binding NarL/FixJ family response regulator [Hydrogenophaga laconesensis]
MPLDRYRFVHPMSPLKTFIVEDNKVIYENLVSTLEELANVEVVGHAKDEETAVQWLHHGERFDLMIIDIFLLTGSGLGVLKAAQDAQVEARRVVLTNYATPDIRKRCALLGADRVFDKSCELEDLIAYCERISDGSATTPGGIQ